VVFIRLQLEKSKVVNTGKTKAFKPLECVVLNAGNAPYLFKFLKTLGMYFLFMENITV